MLLAFSRVGRTLDLPSLHVLRFIRFLGFLEAASQRECPFFRPNNLSLRHMVSSKEILLILLSSQLKTYVTPNKGFLQLKGAGLRFFQVTMTCICRPCLLKT